MINKAELDKIINRLDSIGEKMNLIKTKEGGNEFEVDGIKHKLHYQYSYYDKNDNSYYRIVIDDSEEEGRFCYELIFFNKDRTGIHQNITYEQGLLLINDWDTNFARICQ